MVTDSMIARLVKDVMESGEVAHIPEGLVEGKAGLILDNLLVMVEGVAREEEGWSPEEVAAAVAWAGANYADLIDEADLPDDIQSRLYSFHGPKALRVAADIIQEVAWHGEHSEDVNPDISEDVEALLAARGYEVSYPGDGHTSYGVHYEAMSVRKPS